MKKLISILLCGLMLFSSMPAFAKEAGTMPEVLNLQTEYLTEPLGIDEACPRFSWHIASDKRGVMQGAYRIVVYKDEDNIVWDTGKVESEASNNIDYKGLPLESKTKYYWKVKVWDNYGNESDFSYPASFETAFLNNEWIAEWISPGDTTYPKEQIVFDNPVSARYIRLNASKLGERVNGWGETGYRLQLAEFQIYSQDGENVALGKTVTSPQVFTNATWSPNYVVDGEVSSSGTTQGYTSQMYSSADTNVTVTVDLGKEYSINKVVLYPRNDTQSVNPPHVASFPKSYKIEYSTDGASFESAYSVENATIPQFKENKGLPVFGKKFTVDEKKEIASARAYASGLGLFKMHINGQKVTDSVLEPGETNFDKKAFYVTYDITDKIVNGENAVGVYMGKGFYYNPSSDSTRYNRSPKIWGPMMFISQIEITYTDGTKDIFATDESWRFTQGPVTESVWLGGEDYDANCEIENFATADCDMSAWELCEIIPEAEYPFERLEAKDYNSIKVVADVDVESITEIINSDGTKSYTVKFERNFAGVYTFKASYEKGTKITFKPAEHVNANGTVNQSSTIMWGSSGSIFDTYTFKGAGVEEYTPEFVYHGFQYLQIDGSDKPITKDMLKGHVYRCDNEVAGDINASDENVTKVHQMITNSISDNMFNVITDCPHREKLGWLEVSHLLYPSIAYNFNVASYMEKISDDMIDAQKESGSIPAIVPPLTVGKSEHALRNNSDDDTPNDPTWCGAHIMVPWYTYVTYGDTRQLEKAYDSMAEYFAYLTTLAERSSTPYILENSDLNRDLGDWMSVESTPVTFVVTCTYYQLATVMAEISEVLGKDSTYYDDIAENIKNAINEKYFNYSTGSYGTSQTASALPLYLGIVPEGYENSVIGHLAENVENNSFHLTAGEVGLKPVFNMLSEYGYSDYAYKMIMNETSPSYYYFVANGKTTLPEIWDGGASQDHCMAGHGEGWLYEYLGGIRNASVAYKDIIIEPHIAEELTHFEARVDTAYGEIVSKWEKHEESLIMNVTIPQNTTAKVYFDVKSATKVSENGVELALLEGVKDVFNEGGKVVALVGSGSYSFEMPLEKTVKSPVVKLEPTTSAKGGANPHYATDGNINTAFKIETQTESDYANQYIQFDFDGTEAINKIVVKKQKITVGGNTTYWGDHSYAVGCVLEGSFDGENWETVHTMAKNADGMDSQSEVVINLETPKAYKHIRYIRKEKNSYIGWASNGGNKLILADIEFYALKLTVNTAFADNMVIQRNEDLTVSGKGVNGAVITVTVTDGLNLIEGSATVENGKWTVTMENTLPKGTGYTIVVTDGEVGKKYENVAVGDVYLLAGQSNMERLVSLLGDASPANGNTNPVNDNVRVFNYYKGFSGTDGGNGSTEALDEPMYNKWSVMDSQSEISNVSAVGYYFANEIESSENTPVGLYSVAVGGSAIDKWLPGGALYNSRIYPFKDMAISGILWYQGEQDSIEKMTSGTYAVKMASVINEYRALWNKDDLPFYYAELMRIDGWKGQDSIKYDFSEIRKGQSEALKLVKNNKNTGIVPTLDIYGNYSENTTFRDIEGRIWTGNARTDIHPWNKQEIATRFAAFVLRDVYGKDTNAEGPVPFGAAGKGNKIIIGFAATGSLKIASPENYMDQTAKNTLTEAEISVLGEFEVSADGVTWYSATANIFDESFIEVYSESVEKPLYVRYAHSAYPETPNLTDETELPPVNFDIAVNDEEKCICSINGDKINVYATEAMNVNVIFSSYTNEGALDKVTVLNETLKEGQNTIETPEGFSKVQFDAMVWNSTQKMNPLCGKITMED